MLGDAMGKEARKNTCHEYPGQGCKIIDHDKWRGCGCEFCVPFGRMGIAEDLTGMAIFLATDEAKYIVAQCYNVDGGQWMS